MIAETVCSAVAAAGLGVAAITAYRRRFLAAARVAGYALVPLGLVMTGVVDWLADTAFSPTAWAGFAVLGVSWLLFASTRAVERRRGGARKEHKERNDRKDREARKAAGAAAQRDAVAPTVSAPSLGQGTRPAAKPAPASAPRSEDDFSDIEAILKKHGI
jgi:hypothetical protein